MRPINNFALHAFAAAVLTAFAATGAAAQFLGDSTPGATGAARDGQTRYLALGDSIPGATGAIKNDGRGGGWIEIERWDWGETQACCKGIDYLIHVTHIKPSRDPDRPLVAGRVPNAGVEREMKKSGEKGRNAPASAGGARVAGGDVDGDGRAAWDPKNDDFAVSGRMVDGAPKVGTQIGKAIGNPAADGDDSAAPAEKRQHGWVTVPTPRDRGAVRVKVKTPWVGCKVGARYPALTLGAGGERYELQDAIITSCASENVSFNYAKVTVRG